jgi:hypothetical protein
MQADQPGTPVVTHPMRHEAVGFKQTPQEVEHKQLVNGGRVPREFSKTAYSRLGQKVSSWGGRAR